MNQQIFSRVYLKNRLESEKQKTIDDMINKLMIELINVAKTGKRSYLFDTSKIFNYDYENCLKLLGLSSDADVPAIKRAYRLKSLEFHPDKPGGSSIEFQKLTKVYEYLINNRKTLSDLDKQIVVLNQEIILAIHKRFPDYAVSTKDMWVEINPIKRVLKKGILIDWS
jgi:hypothetical protein